MSDRTNPEAWIEVVCTSATKVGPLLGLDPCRVLSRIDAPASELSGMSVTLAGQRPIAAISVLTDADGRRAIARALFRMGEGEQPTERDEADAVGELANMISGQVRAAMSAIDWTMRLGLPVPATASDLHARPEQLGQRVAFGRVPAALVVTLR